jgi:hypothetical protein
MRSFLAILLMAIAAPALAEQQLIPTPYPSGGEGARILSAPPSYRHQELLPTPYERSLGPNALGDPRTTHTRRHQRLVKTPYPRQYR